MSGGSRDPIEVYPRARVVPIPEPNGLVVGRAASSDDDGYEYQADEAQDFDTAADDFTFSIVAYTHQVDGQDENQTDADDDCR